MVPRLRYVATFQMVITCFILNGQFLPITGDTCGSNVCEVSSTVIIGTESSSTTETTYCCPTGAFVSLVRMANAFWIDAFQFECSDGTVSPWFGDEDGVSQSYMTCDGGVTAITASHIEGYTYDYPADMFMFCYKEDWLETYSGGGTYVGPFGNADTDGDGIPAYSDVHTTISCPEGSFASGFTLRNSTDYIFGVGLQCTVISSLNSSTCSPDGLLVPTGQTPAPTVVTTPTPTPAPAVGPTPSPLSQGLSTPTPTQHASTFSPITPAPTEIKAEGVEGNVSVETRPFCSDGPCSSGYCCSIDNTCGTTLEYCRDGKCCAGPSDSECYLAMVICEGSIVEDNVTSGEALANWAIGLISAVSGLFSIIAGIYGIKSYCEKKK